MSHTENLKFWIKVSELFEEVCHRVDQTWQKRKRILNTTDIPHKLINSLKILDLILKLNKLKSSKNN